MLPKATGIYQIDCIPTQKLYVGSALNMYRRWHAHHLPSLRNQTHFNRHLQSAWNKYGEEAFTCSSLETCDKLKLTEREQHYFDTLSPFSPRGFNICQVARSCAGVKHDEAYSERVRKQKSKDWIVRSPEGREQEITNLSRFCRENGLTSQAMCAVACGKKSHHKGWECRRPGISREDWLASLYAPPRKEPTFVGDQKRCPACADWKSIDQFHANARTASGLASYCQECSRKRNKQYYASRSRGTILWH